MWNIIVIIVIQWVWGWMHLFNQKYSKNCEILLWLLWFNEFGVGCIYLIKHTVKMLEILLWFNEFGVRCIYLIKNTVKIVKYYYDSKWESEQICQSSRRQTVWSRMHLFDQKYSRNCEILLWFNEFGVGCIYLIKNTVKIVKYYCDSEWEIKQICQNSRLQTVRGRMHFFKIKNTVKIAKYYCDSKWESVQICQISRCQTVWGWMHFFKIKNTVKIVKYYCDSEW